MPALSAALERDNEEALDALVAQLRAPAGGVIPFIGAGMSMNFGFPTWAQFLRQEAEAFPAIVEIVERGDYLTAAQALEDRLRQDRFHLRIKSVFGREPDAAKLTDGPLATLASLVTGPVITTNFDHVLERVFAVAGNSFEEVILGAQLDSIVGAIHTGRHVLLKIHGDANERTSRTFTLLEYRNSYDEGDIKVPDLALLMFGNRPLLFLGSSLARPDRTIDVLEDVHNRLRGVRHFAIVAADSADSAMTGRRDDLDASGISPIWVPAGRYDLIEEHLWQLQRQAASRDLRPRIVASPQMPVPSGRSAFMNLAREVNSSAAPVEPSVIARIARALLDGELAFVLAAETPRQRLIDEVADDLGAPHSLLSTERLRTLLAKNSPQAVLDAVKRRLAAGDQHPSLACRFLATLPGFLRGIKRHDVAAQVILSTDYGTMLERSFAAAGEPFHLLYLMSFGDDQGRFLHRTPDGAVRIIERPELVARVRPSASLIVKLRGGAFHGDDAPGRDVPTSICIEDADIARSASAVLDGLPRMIEAEVRRRRLLMLGYGLLDEPDGDTLARVGGTRSPTESWAFYGIAGALMRGLPDYWARYGVQMRSETPEAALFGLHGELLAEVPAIVARPT